jgi:hypothetical protein
MPMDMASLLSQPSPPTAEPAPSQSAQPGSFQALIRDNPGAAMEQGAQGQPAPNYHLTVAALRHLRTFAQEYADILKRDDIGKADVKQPFIEAMARLLGDKMMSLPQTLKLMGSFPDDPLQQRQWLEQHWQQDRAAMIWVLQHHAAAFPATTAGAPPPMPRALSHIEQMNEIISHYKKSNFGKKDKANG